MGLPPATGVDRQAVCEFDFLLLIVIRPHCLDIWRSFFSRQSPGVRPSWSAVANAESYKVYKSAHNANSFALMSTVTTSQCDDPNVPSYRDYYVIALKGSDESEL